MTAPSGIWRGTIIGAPTALPKPAPVGLLDMGGYPYGPKSPYYNPATSTEDYTGIVNGRIICAFWGDGTGQGRGLEDTRGVINWNTPTVSYRSGLQEINWGIGQGQPLWQAIGDSSAARQFYTLRIMASGWFQPAWFKALPYLDRAGTQRVGPISLGDTDTTIIGATLTTLTDGVISGGTALYSPAANFPPSIAGYAIFDTSGHVPAGTTVAWVDAHHLTLSQAATNGALATTTIGRTMAQMHSTGPFWVPWDPGNPFAGPQGAWYNTQLLLADRLDGDPYLWEVSNGFPNASSTDEPYVREVNSGSTSFYAQTMVNLWQAGLVQPWTGALPANLNSTAMRSAYPNGVPADFVAIQSAVDVMMAAWKHTNIGHALAPYHVISEPVLPATSPTLYVDDDNISIIHATWLRSKYGARFIGHQNSYSDPPSTDAGKTLIYQWLTANPPAVVQTITAAAATQERNDISFPTAVNGGTLVLGYNADPTHATVNWNDPAATVATALTAIPAMAADGGCTGVDAAGALRWKVTIGATNGQLQGVAGRMVTVVTNGLTSSSWPVMTSPGITGGGSPNATATLTVPGGYASLTTAINGNSLVLAGGTGSIPAGTTVTRLTGTTATLTPPTGGTITAGTPATATWVWPVTVAEFSVPGMLVRTLQAAHGGGETKVLTTKVFSTTTTTTTSTVTDTLGYNFGAVELHPTYQGTVQPAASPAQMAPYAGTAPAPWASPNRFLVLVPKLAGGQHGPMQACEPGDGSGYQPGDQVTVGFLQNGATGQMVILGKLLS